MTQRAPCCDSLRAPAAPLFAPQVRRNRRCLQGPSPARRSPRFRDLPSTGEGRRRPSDDLAIPASCNTFWPKQLAGGVSHTLVHSDRHWCLPYLSRDIILQDSAIGNPVFFKDLSLLSRRERLCAPNRRSVVKMSACRTPLDSRLTNATCDNSSDPILNPHDAWYRKSKPVSNPWHYTRYSFPLMRSVYAS